MKSKYYNSISLLQLIFIYCPPFFFFLKSVFDFDFLIPRVYEFLFFFLLCQILKCAGHFMSFSIGGNVNSELLVCHFSYSHQQLRVIHFMFHCQFCVYSLLVQFLFAVIALILSFSCLPWVMTWIFQMYTFCFHSVVVYGKTV